MQESDRKRSTGIGRWIEAKVVAVILATEAREDLGGCAQTCRTKNSVNRERAPGNYGRAGSRLAGPRGDTPAQ